MTEELLTRAQSLRRGAGRFTRAVVEACRDAAEGLLMPSSCLGCAEVGGSLCAACRGTVREAGPPGWLDFGQHGGRIAVHAGVRYEGAVASTLRGFKDQGRSDCAPILADWLAAAMTAALEHLPQNMRSIEVLFPPSNRTKLRERGYHPVQLLLKELGIRPQPMLRLSRATEDQRAMGLAERRHNLSGAFATPADLSGRTFLLIDDVCTTGATLSEMARAVRSAGGNVLAAAVVARVRRRRVSGSEGFSAPHLHYRHSLPITA